MVILEKGFTKIKNVQTLRCLLIKITFDLLGLLAITTVLILRYQRDGIMVRAPLRSR